MELEKRIIKKDVEKGKGFSQITLEDDQIIPDTMPDVVKVIHTWGEIRFEEPRVTSQAVWVNGKLDFHVLYRAEEEGRLEQLEGEIPFQEKLSMDDLEEADQIRLRGRVEDLSASIINSRKLALRGVVDILAVAESQLQQELATGVREGEENLQILREPGTMLDLVYSQKDVLRVRKEIALPSSKSNIDKLLFSCVDPTGLVCSLEPGEILVQGQARICVLYQDPEEELICWETVEEFEGRVESRLTDISGVSWITAEPGPVSLEVREDYDGEQRVLAVEMDFDIRAKVWQEESFSVLSDLYALDRVVTPQRNPQSLQKLLIRNQTKVRLAEQFSLERGQEKILQICCFSGEVTVERSTLREEGIMVEGTLCVGMLYLTGDDYLPVSHLRVYLPFEQLVELPETSGKVRFELSSGVEQLQVSLLDPVKFEVKAMLSLETIAFEEEVFQGIMSVEEELLDRESLKSQPGLVGYTVQKGQRLWDIAKAYHTTEERIRSANQLGEEEILPGQKLMLVKMV